MKKWIVRIVGVLNIVFMAFGAYYFSVLLLLHWQKWPGHPSNFDWLIFALLSSTCLFFIGFVGYSGVQLIRGSLSILGPLAVVFVLEILFFVSTFVLFWMILPTSRATIAVGFWGIAQSPIVPQVITGYPIVGTIVVLLLGKNKKSISTQ